MYMRSEGSNDELTNMLVTVMLGMLYEVTDRFNADGNVPPQAYIVRIDGTARHYECESDGFMGEAFAEYVEKRIDQERGVAVLSIAELWIVDKWDGVRRISEHADRYEALAATVEMVNNPTLLYAWPIERDAKGIARVNRPWPPRSCSAGLFRLGMI